MGVAAVLHNSPGNHAPVVVSMICEGHESRVIQWDEFGCIAMLYQYAGHAAAFTVYCLLLYLDPCGHNSIRNDHTIMTAPLPVCSAKLSMIWPG